MVASSAGEKHSEDVQLTVDGIITRLGPETSQRLGDITALASGERKEAIKLIRESKAGSDRQEKQAPQAEPQGDDAPKTEDVVEAGASQDHLAKVFESQEEAFKTMLADMVDEKHAKLHREYQELLQDHMDDPLPDALRAGHDKPEDLKASEFDELCESCHVLLSTSTFKRDFQLKEVMAINLAQTWAWRRRVTWCIFDANREQDLWEWVRDTFSFALQTGHLVWVRAQKPWDTFHMSVAKTQPARLHLQRRSKISFAPFRRQA